MNSSSTLDTESGLDSPARAGAGAVHGKVGDRIFSALMFAMAMSIFALIFLIGYELAHGSHLALRKFGWRFLIGLDWDPVNERFGAVPFIFGTLVSSALALLLAVPLGIGTAVYLAEFAPRTLGKVLTTFIELLAAVPGVILGLWGSLILVPWLRVHLYPQLQSTLGFLPIFRGPIYGVGLLTAGMVIAIMILPVITSVSREILLSVPSAQREAAFALGATRWEVTRIAVLRYARKGLVGAVVLGLGRALGETMAVLMVIGNRPEIAASLFAPSSTLAGAVANDFTEATSDIHLSALFALGLVLLLLTMLVNAAAQLLLKTFLAPTAAPP